MPLSTDSKNYNVKKWFKLHSKWVVRIRLYNHQGGCPQWLADAADKPSMTITDL